METQKAVKFRIYPTEEQQKALAIQFGHARFVYNAALELRKDMYFADKTSLTYEDTTEALAEFKKNNPDLVWLKDADSQVLQQSLKDLDKAYKRFFDMKKNGTLPKPGKKPRKDGMPKGYPNFKTKHDDQSIRYPQRVTLAENAVSLPKVGKVKAVLHRAIAGKINSATVSKTKNGKYYVSLQFTLDAPEPKDRSADPEVGIDLGLKDFATLSTGEKIAPPKPLHGMKRRVILRQRRLSRKFEAKKHRHWFNDFHAGDHSIRDASRRLAATHEKIANRRKDFHHQLSRRLVKEFGLIAIEDLNVKGMMQNGNLAESIADAGWSQFVNFLTYKQDWAGGQIIRVDRFFPSSKLCADCGHKNTNLKLSDRGWVCENCGTIHDRDVNASKNILNQAVLTATSTVGTTESHAEGDMSQPVGNSAPESIKFEQLSLFALEANGL